MLGRDEDRPQQPARVLAKPNKSSVPAGRGVLQAEVGGRGGDRSKGGRNERQGKKDPSQISFSGGGRAWPEEEEMCRGEQLRPRGRGRRHEGGSSNKCWLQLSGRTDCPEGDESMNRCWSSRRELNREVCRAVVGRGPPKREMYWRTRPRNARVYALCRARCRGHRGGRWTVVDRFDSIKVESSRFGWYPDRVMLSCCVMWCVWCRAVVLQAGEMVGKVLVSVRYLARFLVWLVWSCPAVPRPFWCCCCSGLGLGTGVDRGSRGRTGNGEWENGTRQTERSGRPLVG